MRILLCKSHFAGPVSGSDETLVAYATQLREGGHDLSVVLLYPPSRTDQYYARLTRAGIEVITIAPSRGAQALLNFFRACARRLSALARPSPRTRRLTRLFWVNFARLLARLNERRCRRFFARSEADLLHVLTPDAGAELLIRAGSAAGLPILYQELGTPRPMPELEPHYERFVKVLPLCSEIAALSPLLARQWERRLSRAVGVCVLPLIVEDRAGAHSPPARRAHGVTLGFAARLEGGKGPLTLVEAFARVRAELPHTSLRMAGAGPQERAVRARAVALGIADACEFPGVYTSPEDRSAFLRGLDLFVLPTLAEGTPNSVIEAMAHGLPVIASAVGGIPDLLTPETGVLVPPGDADALAEAIKSLALDREARLRIGRAARARYEQLFSPRSALPALLETYRRVAARDTRRDAPARDDRRDPAARDDWRDPAAHLSAHPAAHPWLTAAAQE